VRHSRSSTIVSVAIVASGLLLLVWLIVRADPRQIWQALGQVGWGFVSILAIAGARFAVRAMAWMRCLEPPHRLTFGEAFTAVLCGDALGNATPLGPLVSEPAKVAFVRDRVPMGAAFTALAIENVFYTLSVAAMIAAGITALMLRGGLERELRLAAEIGIVLVLGVYVAATWVLMRQPAVLSRALGVLARIAPAAGRPHRVDKVRRLEQEIYTFASRRRGTAGAIVVAQLIFHALGVLEVYARRAAFTGHVVHPGDSQPADHRAVQVHPHAAAGRRRRGDGAGGPGARPAAGHVGRARHRARRAHAVLAACRHRAAGAPRHVDAAHPAGSRTAERPRRRGALSASPQYTRRRKTPLEPV
jgi:hypothetical protein